MPKQGYAVLSRSTPSVRPPTLNPSLENEVDELTKKEERNLQWPQNVREIIASYLSPLDVVSEIHMVRDNFLFELHPAKSPLYAVSPDCRFVIYDEAPNKSFFILDTRKSDLLKELDYEKKKWKPVALAIYDANICAIAVKHKKQFSVSICVANVCETNMMIVDHQPTLHFVAFKAMVIDSKGECKSKAILQLHIVTPRKIFALQRIERGEWNQAERQSWPRILLNTTQYSGFKEDMGSQYFRQSFLVVGKNVFVLRVGIAGGDVYVMHEQESRKISRTVEGVLAIGYNEQLGILSVMQESGILSVVYDINSNAATCVSRKLPLGSFLPSAAFFSLDGRTLLVILPYAVKLFDIVPPYLVPAGLIPTGRVTEMISLNTPSNYIPIAFDSLSVSWIFRGSLVIQNIFSGDFSNSIAISSGYSLRQPLAHNPAKKLVFFTTTSNRGIYLVDYSTNPPSMPKRICSLNNPVYSLTFPASRPPPVSFSELNASTKLSMSPPSSLRPSLSEKNLSLRPKSFIESVRSSVNITSLRAPSSVQSSFAESSHPQLSTSHSSLGDLPPKVNAHVGSEPVLEAERALCSACEAQNSSFQKILKDSTLPSLSRRKSSTDSPLHSPKDPPKSLLLKSKHSSNLPSFSLSAKISPPLQVRSDTASDLSHFSKTGLFITQSSPTSLSEGSPASFSEGLSEGSSNLSPSSSPSFFSSQQTLLALLSLDAFSLPTSVPPTTDTSTLDKFEKKAEQPVRHTSSSDSDKLLISPASSPEHPKRTVSMSSKVDHGGSNGHSQPRSEQLWEYLRVLDINPTGAYLLAIIDVRGQPLGSELRLWSSSGELLLRTSISGPYTMADLWLAYMETPLKVRVVTLADPQKLFLQTCLELPTQSLSFVKGKSDLPNLLIVDFDHHARSLNLSSGALLPLSNEIYQNAVLQEDGHLLTFNPRHSILRVLPPAAIKNPHENADQITKYTLDVACRFSSFPSPNILCCHTSDNNVVRYLIKKSASSPSSEKPAFYRVVLKKKGNK